MRYLNEPYYAKYITKEMKQFDDRNTGFSRGAHDGDKYNAMYNKSLLNIQKKEKGKTIFDCAMGQASRTPDIMFRTNYLARSGSALVNNKFKLKVHDPKKLTLIVKEMAKWAGAELVGITEINRLWVYTNWGIHNAKFTEAAKEGDPVDIPQELKYVIVMAHEMDYHNIARSPNREAATSIGYSKVGWCSSTMATFIRELGFKAIPTGNELGLNIPMAVDAGLGEMGRNGLLITREFGPRVRISKVFTDLPLEPDSPIDIGVQKFCENCGLCAEACPSRALTNGERTDKAWDISNSEGLMKWPTKAMKCFDWWVKSGNGCSVCIRVCPWNKPNNFLHRFVRLFAEYKILPKVIVFMDQLLGYGKQRKNDGFDSFYDPSVIEVE